MIASDEAIRAPRRGRLGVVVLTLLVAGAIAIAVLGILARRRALHTVTRETADLAVPTVSVTTPVRGGGSGSMTLPATIEAFSDAGIFARTSGYLAKRYVDIGSRVKKGQLLAEIDVPEVNQQLRQARANLTTAEAREHLAQTTSARYQDLIKTESVSQQDLDMAVGALAARRADAASARANVQRLEQMQGFSKIYAPFDGVVTTRNVDVGALIDAGGGPEELFHIAATSRLRVFVDVPQIYSPAARPGLAATITLNESPTRHFTGTLVRTAGAIDMTTRTLRTEVDVDNPTGELLPGAYAEVTLHLPAEPSSLRVPVSVLIFRSEKPEIAVVRNNHVELRTVTLGHDYGTTVEVVKGLSADEQMVVNPLDSLTAGQTVRTLVASDADATR